LFGAYLGEVLVRTYAGEWVIAGGDPTPSVRVEQIEAHPFATAQRILMGEQFKSFASFGRAIPTVIDHSEASHG
jgi:hypothetical protein